VTTWALYHSVVTRTLLTVNFLLGASLVLIVWTIRRPFWLALLVLNWIDDRLIDLEERVYESAWIARARLPAWKDEDEK